ncbi:MAG: flagellar filament capping protein FliD, partial [Pseudomonadales bacterium]
MASIQSLGVGSGLLTSDLVEDIVAAERESTDLRLNARKAEFDAKISAFGGVRSSLEALQQAAGALSDSDEFLSNVVTSSNPAVLSATATTEAAPGIHAVEILSLARAHTLSTGQYDDLNSVVGEGTLTFNFGTTTFDGTGNYDSFTANAESVAQSVVIDESNNTLAGIRDAINNASIGATASIVNDGSGYVLVLKSDQTGVEQSMEVSVAESGAAGLAALSFDSAANTPGTNMTQTVAADDAVVNVDGIVVSRSNNSIDEVIPGVTINAIALNVGAPATLTVAQDNEQITAKVQTFVDAFNDVKALADELTAFDGEEGQGALLTGDSTLRGIRTQLRRFLGANVADLTSPAIRSLVDLGLSTNQDASFFLSFDAEQFSATLAANPKDVRALLADDVRASDPQIEFLNFGNGTQAGSYDVEVTQLATSGFTEGATVAGLAGSITIDADNDLLTLTVDGISTGALELTQRTYASGAELAIEVENRINAATALSDSGRSASVTFDSAENRFRIESDRLGSRSSIAITQVDDNTAAQLGLDVVSGEANAGLDVAGTINGIEGVGAGEFLRIPNGPAAATAGRFQGANIGSFPVVVADGSNSLVVQVDGNTSNTIEVAAGSFATGGELAQALQSAINADPVLSAAEATATVWFDPGSGSLKFRSDSTGTESTFDLVNIDATLGTDSGLTAGTGTPGQAEGRRDDPVGGAQIRVSGGDTGSRGTVTLVRGVMNQLNAFLNDALGATGALSAKIAGWQAQLSDIDEESADFVNRLNVPEELLRFQLAAADALISQ